MIKTFVPKRPIVLPLITINRVEYDFLGLSSVFCVIKILSIPSSDLFSRLAKIVASLAFGSNCPKQASIDLIAFTFNRWRDER